MKKRLIAGMLASALLLQIFATPVMAIEEIIEDNNENKQVEVVEPEIEQNEEEQQILRGPNRSPELVPDYNLKEAVLTELVLNGTITDDERESHVITVADMETLEQIGAYNVNDFTGLEYATNVINLELYGNQANIFDFNLLQGMTNLKDLSIEDIE